VTCRWMADVSRGRVHQHLAVEVVRRASNPDPDPDTAPGRSSALSYSLAGSIRSGWRPSCLKTILIAVSGNIMLTMTSRSTASGVLDWKRRTVQRFLQPKARLSCTPDTAPGLDSTA